MALKQPITPAVSSIDVEGSKTDESLTKKILRQMEEQYERLVTTGLKPKLPG